MKVLTPTTEIEKAKITAAMKVISQLMENLYTRWLDEREYEDINDYKKVIVESLAKNVLKETRINLRKMTKRPFGFHFDIGTNVVYSYDINLRSRGWSRVS